MRRALFGGTFDPIHDGHLMLAEAARDQYRLDEVLFLPAGRPPHKGSPSASPQDRLAMVRAAIRDNRAFRASDWEIRQERKVYTYETLDHFLKRFPRDRWFFMMGSDSLAQIHLWRGGARLLRRCTFLIADRLEAPWKTLAPGRRRLARRVDSPLIALASHEIRRRVRRGRSIRYQVPAAVERYIRRRRLYRPGGRS